MSADLILAFIGIVGLLVATANVLGSFRTSRNTTTVAGYRDAAQAWEAKAKAQEGEIIDLRSSLAEANVKIDGQERRIQMLQDMVTSKALIEALARALDANHTTMINKIGEVLTATAAIQNALLQSGGSKNA